MPVAIARQVEHERLKITSTTFAWGFANRDDSGFKFDGEGTLRIEVQLLYTPVETDVESMNSREANVSRVYRSEQVVQWSIGHSRNQPEWS